MVGQRKVVRRRRRQGMLWLCAHDHSGDHVVDAHQHPPSVLEDACHHSGLLARHHRLRVRVQATVRRLSGPGTCGVFGTLLSPIRMQHSVRPLHCSLRSVCSLRFHQAGGRWHCACSCAALESPFQATLYKRVGRPSSCSQQASCCDPPLSRCCRGGCAGSPPSSSRRQVVARAPAMTDPSGRGTTERG